MKVLPPMLYFFASIVIFSSTEDNSLANAFVQKTLPAVPVSGIAPIGTGHSGLACGSTINLIRYQAASVTSSMRGLSPSARMFAEVNRFLLENDADVVALSKKDIHQDVGLSLPPLKSTESTSIIALGKRVLNGILLAPAMLTAPLYAIGFGVFGYSKMWAFSEWIYSFSNSSESWVHDHFSRMQKYLLSDKTIASKKKSWSYRIHPTFAGLSLISTAVLAFVDHSKIDKIISRKWLLVANTCICFASALSARALENTMLGNASAKKWNSIQGNLSMFFAALTLSSGWLGNLMIHLNWSILFAGGFLERMYVLCILPQFKINKRSEYIKYYSPQIPVATLGSLPLGIATYFMFGSILPM